MNIACATVRTTGFVSTLESVTLGCVGVVGSSRGLGFALAEIYAAQGRETVGFARSPGSHDAPFPVRALDVRSVDSLGALRAWAEATRGSRLVVMTAGVLGPVGALASQDMERWAEAVQVNLVGVANVLHVLAPYVTSEDRVVVFTGGGVGGPNMQPRVSAYTASKAGVAVLLEEVASDESFAAPVVGLAPGAYATGFADEVLQVGAEVAGNELFEQVSRTKKLDFDISNLLSVLDFIESSEGAALNGRIVSAQRDDLSEARALCLSSTDAFRLRRVDDRSVRIVAPW